ncbi:MAG: hypothetical protein ACP5OB_06385 [Candidatus Ratteibacteria bacterium]
MKKKYLIIFSIVFLTCFLMIILIFKDRKLDIDKLNDEQIIELLKSEKMKILSQDQLLLLGERLKSIPYERIERLIETLPEEIKYRVEENFEKISYARLDKLIEEFYNSPPEKQEEILNKEIDRLEEAEAKGEIPVEYSELYEEKPESQNSSFFTFQRRGFFKRSYKVRNPDAALQRQRNRLSQTTPEQRAKRQEFIKKLREKRAQRRGFSR